VNLNEAVGYHFVAVSEWNIVMRMCVWWSVCRGRIMSKLRQIFRRHVKP